MKKYNGYDELSDRKRMQNWPASKKFHDDNDKRIAELEKEKADRDKKKSTNFTIGRKNVTGKYKMNEVEFRGLVSKMIKESLSNFGKNMLKEDAWDTPYFIDKVIKSAYKLRHQIHNVYNQCDYGDFDNVPKKGIAQPSGYQDADGKIEKLLYDAYYSIDRLIKDLKAASAEFVKEMNDEMYGDEEGGLDQIDAQENVPPTMNESQLQKVITDSIASVLQEWEQKK